MDHNYTAAEIAKQIDTKLYRERWVALVKGRVSGVGLSRDQAYRAAKRNRPKDRPLLFYVDEAGHIGRLHTDEATSAGWVARQPLLRQTIDLLQQRHIEAYLVGGAVRDFLLGRDDVVDLDFALPDSGLTVARQVADALQAAYYALDATRETGRVVCQNPAGPEQPPIFLDFATFRGDTLAADLADRDFTINAMALSLDDSLHLIDPLNGRQDLEAGQIRAVAPHAFENDPIRILRAVRQANEFGFAIEPETARLAGAAAALLPQVSAERQRDELLKLLNTPRPGGAVQILQQLGVLPHCLPEVEALVGVEQTAPHHLDVFTHTTTALDSWAALSRAGWPDFSAALRPQLDDYFDGLLAGNLSLRKLMPLALLLHDTGKPLTRSETVEDGRRRIRFLGHEQESATLARQVAQRLHLSTQAASFLERVVQHHMRPLLLAAEPKVSRRAMYRYFRDTTGPGYQAGVAVALHTLADQRATYPPGHGRQADQTLLALLERLLTAFFVEQTQVVSPEPLLTGRDLIDTLDVRQGPLIGRLLRDLKEAQAVGEVQSRAEALAFVRAILRNLDADLA